MVNIELVGQYQERKSYFFKIGLICLMLSSYLFTMSNYMWQRYEVGSYNLIFGILFTIIYLSRDRNLENSMLITGVLFQIFIFGHAYYLIPGKQMEEALGGFICVLPIFISGKRLWLFFITNFVLYHLIIFNVGYGDIFYFKYIFYVSIFIIFYNLIKANQAYEQELISQRDRIQRAAQQLKELDELKTRFFANISHELRTPLTLLLSPLDSVLESNEISEQTQVYLSLARENGQQLQQRINELLELSKLDARHIEINKQAVNLVHLMRRSTHVFESAAKLKLIELSYTNQSTDELHCLLDVQKVEMILSNFLSNALKFTPEGGQVKVDLQVRDKQLIISVKDTGIGISSANLDKVFDRFYQVKDKNYTGGTGIGLALCKELAEIQGGKVWVTSGPGKGSTFYLELPYETAVAQITPEVSSPLIGKLIPDSKVVTAESPLPVILVVEDNASLQQYMSLLLSEDYKVVNAENGLEALQYMETAFEKKELPALIISDIMMPKMDGIELLQQFKAHPVYRQLPVIMLTAKQHTDTKIDALRIGVDDYLSKPFKPQELKARVANLIKNRQHRVEVEEVPNSKYNDYPAISAADLKWLETLENILLTNLANTQFKLSDAADQMTISYRRLQQRLKKITGLTPKQYQRDIMLSNARQFLKSGEVETVAEVAFRVGYDNSHYFSKLYKEAYGIMPSEELQNLSALKANEMPFG